MPDSPEDFPDPGYWARQEVNQEYFFVNFDHTSLIGMNYPIRVAPLTNWDASSFLRIYRVISRVSDARLEELASVGAPSGSDESQPDYSLSGQELEIYTAYGGDERIRELADKIVA